MTTLQNIVTEFKNRIGLIENKHETGALLDITLEHVFGYSRMHWMQHLDKEIAVDDVVKLQLIIAQLEKHEPIQYILNEAHFYDLVFEVNPSVLIPRQETEELVHWIIQENKHSKAPFSILDIGSGSGCIPISLKKNLPNAQVFSCDISDEALLIAQQNAKSNAVDVSFFKQNILQHSKLPLSKFDIIVSNPPYVTQKEKLEIKANVLNNEPHLALFVQDDNPLIFYKAIAGLANQYLSDTGVLFFEINQYLGAETIQMLQKKGFQTKLRKDLNNNDRMIKAWL